MSSSVSIKINGQSYSIACEAGQEDRVKSLGEYINKRVTDISSSGASLSEAQLMVLSSLVLADEIFELRDENERLKLTAEQSDPVQESSNQECISPEELEKVRQEALEKAMERETEIAFSISEIADDIQGLAKRLQSV